MTGPCWDCRTVLWIPGPQGQYSEKVRFVLSRNLGYKTRWGGAKWRLKVHVFQFYVLIVILEAILDFMLCDNLALPYLFISFYLVFFYIHDLFKIARFDGHRECHLDLLIFCMFSLNGNLIISHQSTFVMLA